MAAQYDAPPEITIDLSTTYTAKIDTSAGEITVEFYAADAPQTVNNFVFLAREGFYDGVIFHRTIPGFMIQGGDPTGTGTGGPGYEYDGEFDPGLRHDRPGLLSMANRGPGTDGSQFFLTFVPTPHLDGRHTIFGEVVEGMGTVQELEKRGIGRPSTYAAVITTIQSREYVVKKSGALLPSYIGIAVTHLLREHFNKYVDTQFTARMEEEQPRSCVGESAFEGEHGTNPNGAYVCEVTVDDETGEVRIVAFTCVDDLGKPMKNWWVFLFY